MDSDGAYFVRMEYEAHNKGVSSLVMLSEGTLLSGGDKDRKIVAWDSLQNYKKITETKVLFVKHGNDIIKALIYSYPNRRAGCVLFTPKDREEMTATSM